MYSGYPGWWYISTVVKEHNHYLFKNSDRICRTRPIFEIILSSKAPGGFQLCPSYVIKKII